MNRWGWLGLVLVALSAAPACKTSGYCFENCEGEAGGTGGSGGSAASGAFGGSFGNGGRFIPVGGEGGQGDGCIPAPDGAEICNGEDDDCDGLTDEPVTAGDSSGVNFNDTRTCGNCDTNCETSLRRVTGVGCVVSGEPGVDPGTCTFEACSTDWYDANDDLADGCEYFCPFNTDGASTDDPGGPTGCGQDDDCDGEIDEDMDVCSELANCGECGNNCEPANATGVCRTTADVAGGEACTPDNTGCEIEACDPGWHDVDGSPDNGCEYQCTRTNNGVEICDGLDNDCDRKIDNADGDLEIDDPNVGDACQGALEGVCAQSNHRGVKKCIGSQILCCETDSNNISQATNTNLPQTGLRNGVCRSTVAPIVVFPNDLPETCNGIDDDCDGAVDDAATDAGGACGQNLGNCSFGVQVCQGGRLQCVGAVGAQPEVCDGEDNDCDGVIDGTLPTGATDCTSDGDCSVPNVCRPVPGSSTRKCVKSPDDVAGSGGFIACNVPPPAPQNASSPCQAGVSACRGGLLVCEGSIVPSLGQDTCGVDANCDGVLDNQTNLLNDDPANCGSCGNDCAALGANGDWTCEPPANPQPGDSSQCVFNGCKQGFIECGGASPNDCETACTFESSTESCDGVDNDCDCQTDEVPISPQATPAQVCGVSPSATDAGCTSGVGLVCTNGGWDCSFPSGYCDGSSGCSNTVDVCDGLDNDCDGIADEAFVAPTRTQGFLGQACTIGQGACAANIGAFACTTDGSDTECAPRACTTDAQCLPGTCSGGTCAPPVATSEVCNGIDDDCNGVIDDNLTDPTAGNVCSGGANGVCNDVEHQGAITCVGGTLVCVGADLVFPGQLPETCNGKDDDCDGTDDNNVPNIGAACGSNVGQCAPGVLACTAGILECQGGQLAVPEICNGLDDNCNGVIDDNVAAVGGACDVPPAATTEGYTNPCRPGAAACIGTSLACQGSVVAAPGAVDRCFEDTNCDGVYTAPSPQTDVNNCGSCGNKCSDQDPNANWACVAGACVFQSCKAGSLDCDNNQTCETACTFSSSTELCNGIDDDCDCLVDAADPDIVVPSPVQVCGVSPLASATGCVAPNVGIACVAGAWDCSFPADYCDGATCTTSVELCDGIDNDCDGATDEIFKFPAKTTSFLGQACTSGNGPCQVGGVYTCAGNGQGTVCGATANSGASTTEVCDGLDNDCDGAIDDAPSDAGGTCQGGTTGLCADVTRAGTFSCQAGLLRCQGGNVVRPGEVSDTCNGVDDDCDGFIDGVAQPGGGFSCNIANGNADCVAEGIYSLCIEDQTAPGTYFCVAPPVDDGGPCGQSSLGNCQLGIGTCDGAGNFTCTGNIDPVAEECNGLDDDCDGVADDAIDLTDINQPCQQPGAPPPADEPLCPAAGGGIAFPCSAGTTACVSGVLECQNAVTAPNTDDGCCADLNCDGVLDNQPDTDADVSNCGACGNDCYASAPQHTDWACVSGSCQSSGCEFGYADCNPGVPGCETSCVPTGPEICDGVDNDCDCVTDNVTVNVPDPTQVCNVSTGATEDGCKSTANGGDVVVACTSGSWQCTFPANYCTTGDCLASPDPCDSLDNDCDGLADESFRPAALPVGGLGSVCYSDDGLPPPGDGACRTSGVFQCNGPSATACSATRNDAAASAEQCNGVDDDCDGAVDETYLTNPSGATGVGLSVVRPAVVEYASGKYVFQYEASRPTATAASAGSGNGYHCTPGTDCNSLGVPSGPPGVTIDRTTACSVDGNLPWFNVSPVEVEQTCDALGGFVCPTADWTDACDAESSCDWGYETNCTVSSSATCNLHDYDFVPGGSTIEDGLLPTASLAQCFADNSAGAVYDITGNLREITKRGNDDYPLMGGAFNTQSEDGAVCDFAFFSVKSSFRFFDTGFRCCFDQNPSPAICGDGVCDGGEDNTSCPADCP